MKKQVVSTLERINWNFGRGDIISVNMSKGIVVRKPFQCSPETRRFRLTCRDGKFYVRFLGRTRLVRCTK